MATDSNGMITLSREFSQIVDNTDDLKKNVYPDLQINMCNREWLYERVILVSTNVTDKPTNYIIQGSGCCRVSLGI